MAIQHEKVCSNCNKSFIPHRGSPGIYCSIECRIIGKSNPLKERDCTFCNEKFFPSQKHNHSKQRFCSLNCYIKLRNYEKQKLIDTGYYKCPKHGLLPIDNFRTQKRHHDKLLPRYICRICDAEHSKNYRENNTEKLRKTRQAYYSRPEIKKHMLLKSYKWRKDNRERNLELRANYRKKYKEKIKEKLKIAIKELKPYIVKNWLGRTKLRMNEIPKELIDAKRTEILIRRKIREIKNGNS